MLSFLDTQGERERLIRKLQGDADGSFYVVSRALRELSKEKNSNKLEYSDVRDKIKEILNKELPVPAE